MIKVVSIEDEPQIAELMQLVLGSPEIDLYTEDDGISGLELIRQVKPDLIVLDIMMPGISGWDVYDAVRADEELKKTPIIMLSVMREDPDRRRTFMASGIDLYMTKPFDALRLRQEVERILGRQGLWERPKPAVTPVPEKMPAGKPAPAAVTSVPGAPERPSSPPTPEKAPAGKSAPAAVTSAAGAPERPSSRPVPEKTPVGKSAPPAVTRVPGAPEKPPSRPVLEPLPALVEKKPGEKGP
jgi:CheY-like chemotaxis protein